MMKASFDLLENNRIIINRERKNATPEEPDDRKCAGQQTGQEHRQDKSLDGQQNFVL
jgi:hypothetical protein